MSACFSTAVSVLRAARTPKAPTIRRKNPNPHAVLSHRSLSTDTEGNSRIATSCFLFGSLRAGALVWWGLVGGGGSTSAGGSEVFCPPELCWSSWLPLLALWAACRG